MAPAGNNKHCQDAMRDTFYLTNVVPQVNHCNDATLDGKDIVLLTSIIWMQDLDNNGNYWNRLEIWVRDLTQKFQDVWVVSGPLWLPEAEHQPAAEAAEAAGQGDGKAAGRGRKTPAVLGRVSYPVLGAGQVAVPTHLYKVVLVSDPTLTRPLLSCFVVPNQPLGDRHLTEFSLPLQQLETAVGLTFHPDLEREQTADLCTETGCNLWDYKQFQQFFWSRRLKNPWNLRSLEKDWAEAVRKGVISPELTVVYNESKARLLAKDDEEKATSEKAGKENIVAKEKSANDSDGGCGEKVVAVPVAAG